MADCLKKQVVVLVEGNADFGPYWPTILNKYLNDLIRSFSQNGSSSSSEVATAAADCLPSVEFMLVVFNACGTSNFGTWLYQSRWTNDVNLVLKRLEAIDFSSFASSDATISSGAATAEGLAQALSIFRCPSNESQNQRHCILVSAGEPDNYPPHPDMKKVTKLLTQSNVSLCALYPLHELQKLGAVSNALINLSINQSNTRAATTETDPA